MADTPNNGGETQQEPKPAPPVFDDAQKAHITNLIEERMARATAKAEADKKVLAEQLKAKDAELAAEREKNQKESTSTTHETDKEREEAEKKQYKHLIDQEKARTKAAAEKAAELEKRVTEVTSTNKTILKNAAIRDAVEGQDNFQFHDFNTVRKLTEDRIFFDEDSQTYQVKDENNVVMQNSSLQPMSLKEFYAQYAASAPYLVRSGVKSGTGAGASDRQVGNISKITSKADFKTRQDKVDYITKFGGEAFEKLPSR